MTDNWFEKHLWVFALILTLVFAPLILWAGWREIGSLPSTWMIIATSTGIVALTYVGFGLLLVWNRWTQRKYRETGVIKDKPRCR
ncbi:MAG: hypothetical protein SPI12_06385 [Actinomycetaceae bacterium]|nr:hypothetical protein [Actinomycetaceae bacterium]MDY6083465.1 hypothetical protein [Actinomycetaceae bacterium]